MVAIDRGWALAQFQVLNRCLLMTAVGYGAYVLLSSSNFEPLMFLYIVAALFFTANAVFSLVRWYWPSGLDAAEALERKL